MHIEDKEIERLGRSVDISAINNRSRNVKSIKVLVISENSSDIYMIQKIFPKRDGVIIHEAATLSAALKILNYLNIDLLLVDDRLSDLDGYEIVSKLNVTDITKDIPKIILLTEDYKVDKKESFQAENVDFVKKPFDSVLFKLRVKSLLSLNTKKEANNNYLQQLSMKKFQEAQDYMHVYHDIFDRSENILCIYDNKSKKVIEANEKFSKFFLNNTSFNRILENERLVRKFVPYIDEANYLNYYEPTVWMDTLIDGIDFTFLIKLQRDHKEYSFNISNKKLNFNDHDFYLLKLSNIYDYLPQKNDTKKDTKQKLQEKNLESFKEDFIALRTALKIAAKPSNDIENLLYSLSTKLSIVCDDSSIVEEKIDNKEIDVYFMLVQLFKEKFTQHAIVLNEMALNDIVDVNKEDYYAKINPDAFNDLVFGIVNNFYATTFSDTEKEHKLILVLLKEQKHINLQIQFEDKAKKENDASIVGKIFTKNKTHSQEDILGTLPKNVKQSLFLLHAEITKVVQNNQMTFSINIPI